MKLLFSSKEKLIITAVLILFILFIVIAQFYFLSPIKSDLHTKQQTLKTEKKLLADLRKKVNSYNGTTIENTTELQRQLPVKPLQDQFILDLQQAENVSGSQIKTMSFTEGGQVAAASSQNNTSNSSSIGQTSGSTSSTNNQNSSSSSSTAQQQTSQSSTSSAAAKSSTAVSGVNKLTAQLSVESPNYQEFEKFIDALEGLKRITVVEAINYTGSTEVTSLQQESKPFNCTLTVSSYYFPSLTDLQSQLPKEDYPDPANKNNPLVQFPDLTAAP